MHFGRSFPAEKTYKHMGRFIHPPDFQRHLHDSFLTESAGNMNREKSFLLFGLEKIQICSPAIFSNCR